MKVKIYDVVTGVSAWTSDMEDSFMFWTYDDGPGECDCVRGELLYPDSESRFDCGQERFVIVGYHTSAGEAKHILAEETDFQDKLTVSRAWNLGRPDSALIAAGLFTEEEFEQYVPVAAEPEPITLTEALDTFKDHYADEDFRDTLVNLTARFIRDVNSNAFPEVLPLHTHVGYADSFTLARAILDMQFGR